jgi:hypothetical protein
VFARAAESISRPLGDDRFLARIEHAAKRRLKTAQARTETADRGGSERRQRIKCTVTVIPLDERSKGRPDKQSDNAHLCCQFQHTVTAAAF